MSWNSACWIILDVYFCVIHIVDVDLPRREALSVENTKHVANEGGLGDFHRSDCRRAAQLPSAAEVIWSAMFFRVLFVTAVCLAILYKSNSSGCGEQQQSWSSVEHVLRLIRKTGSSRGWGAEIDREKAADEEWGDEYDRRIELFNRLRRSADMVQRLKAKDPKRDCAIELTKGLTAGHHEFATMSRLGTDGILFYIFGLIGTTSRTAVEIDSASGRGIYFATASLASFMDWNVLMLYPAWSAFAYANDVLQSRAATAKRAAAFAEPPVVSVQEIGANRTDFNRLLIDHAVGGQIDLLCLFTEDSDYWIWKSLTQVKPRVLVLTYQQYWGPEEAVVRSRSSPSRGESDTKDPLRRHLFVGASLGALVKLAEKKGYNLVYCFSTAPIAIFVLRSPSTKILSPVLSSDCFKQKFHSVPWRKDMAAQWDEAQRFEWEHV